jgi:hypothetical protein
MRQRFAALGHVPADWEIYPVHVRILIRCVIIELSLQQLHAAIQRNNYYVFWIFWYMMLWSLLAMYQLELQASARLVKHREMP